jgi:predicted nucleic acid-binding protein
MIVLDTNIVSVMMRPETAPRVLDWLDTQPAESVWTTVITLFEIRYGLAVLPLGRRRSSLESNFQRVLQEGLAERILDFDPASAWAAAELMARLEASGRGIELRDLQIAGIVTSRRATLATRNTRHFFHTTIELVDPWEA